MVNLPKQEFDIDQFKSKGYTTEEILLFNDIAFLDGRIRKWETDIRIEIKGEPGPMTGNIDSAINEIAPLIVPLSIKVVEKDGNVIISRGKRNFLDKFIKTTTGRAKNNSNLIYPAISKAWIMEYQEAGCKTILHELEHAIGLTHPRKTYPFLMKIIGSNSPQYNYDYLNKHPDRKEFFQGVKLTKQEKKVIQMLYSPEIKSGLTRKTFMKELGIQDDPKIWRPTIWELCVEAMPYFIALYIIMGLHILFVLTKKIIKKINDKKRL